MPEPRFTTCLLDFVRAFDERAIKRPVSIQLASKEEAFRLVREIDPAGWLVGSTSCETIGQGIESGKMQSFLLFGIEFWWRPSIAAVELQQGLKAVA